MSTEVANTIQAIASMVTAFVALAAAIVAWRGLKTWRAELRGKDEYDLARRIYYESIRLQESIVDFRMSEDKFKEEWDELRYELMHQRFDDYQEESATFYSRIYTPRFRRFKESLESFRVLGIDAEVLWESDFMVIYDSIIESAAQLQSAYDRLIFLVGEVSWEDDMGILITRDNDFFGKEVEMRIKLLKDYLRPKLSG